jgi:hypothetical protein
MLITCLLTYLPASGAASLISHQALISHEQLLMRGAPFAARRGLWRERPAAATAAVEEVAEEEESAAASSPLDLDIGGEGGYFDHDQVSMYTNVSI